MTTPHERPFRFGVGLLSAQTREEWVSAARRAEALGYDVVSVADHLNVTAPVPALMLVAQATERVTIATSVLNTAFYTPHLLVRELGAVDRFCDGRLEVGLGAGYVRDEFDAVGLRFPPPGERVAHLERTVDAFRGTPAEPGSGFDRLPVPTFTRPSGPPIKIGGRGDRVLRLAAERADVVALTGTTRVPDGDVLRLGGADELAERAAYVHGLLGDRAGDVELNLPIQRVLPRGTTGTDDPWGNDLEMSPSELAEIPSVLVGSPRECADRLRERRERFGISYFSVTDAAMEAFATVIAEIR